MPKEPRAHHKRDDYDVNKAFNFSAYASEIENTFVKWDRRSEASIRLNEVAISKRFGGKLKYEKKDIIEALEEDNIEELREISNYFYRTSGVYSNIILFYSTLMTYDRVVTPQYRKKYVDMSGKKDRIQSDMQGVFNFLNGIGFEDEMMRMMFYMFKDGAYYGYLEKSRSGKWVLVDLPINYCRSISKTEYNTYTVEFDVTFIDNFTGDSEMLRRILNMLPKEIVSHYRWYKRNSNKVKDAKWVQLDPNYSVAFFFPDDRPIFVNAIPEIIDLIEYRDIEKVKDSQVINTLLAHKLPIGSDNELIFDLTEAKDLHRSIAAMFRNNPNMDVITTFGELKAVDTTDTNSIIKDNLLKIERSAYGELGVSQELFSASNSISLNMALKKNESLVFDMIPMFNNQWNVLINTACKKNPDFFYKVNILPISHYNRTEMRGYYKDDATLGLPITPLYVSSGFKQEQLMPMVDYENQVLEIKDKLVPPNTSYTTDGQEEAAEAKTAAKTTKKATSEETKSEKTIENEESKGNG